MAPKTITTTQRTPETNTLLDKAGGAFVFNGFLIIWLTSLSSPTILLVSIWYGWLKVSLAIITICVFAYAPWKKGPISSYIENQVSWYAPCHFQSTTVLYEGESPPQNDDKQTMYAIHPHGAFCNGWSILFSSPELRSSVRFCFSPILLMSPFFRLFSRTVGNPGSASRSSMIQYLKRGENLALPPGGFEEATLTSMMHDRVFIKKRTGFIKLCLQYGNGMAVRPTFVFGERKLFYNLQGWWNFRLNLNRYGIPAILFWGKWFFPIGPRNEESLYIVVGKPIVLPKLDRPPTKEEVTIWHKRYVDELRRLFEDHKEAAYGPQEGKSAKLEIW